MITLLVDANLDGQADLLDMRLRTDAWRDLRDYLDIQFVHFESVGLDRTATDAVVWRLCQERSFYLLTANRNSEGEDSLEATMRTENTAANLPILTLANARELFTSNAYLDRVVEKLLDYLLHQENYRGAGRLFLP